MRFGLHTGQHAAPFGELLALWRDAADWGFDACYVFDHVVPLHSDVEAFLPEEASERDGPCLEGSTTLAAMTRAVPRIGLGLMVAAVGYRTAGYLGHLAGTLARAAPGRIEIGIGTGWFEPDYRILGLPFPSPRERLEALEAALGVLRPRFRSQGVRLWVAGTGERRTIPLAARFADAWNAMYLTTVEYGAKVDVLRRACEAAGRDPETIERSIALRGFCATDRAQAELACERWAIGRGRDPIRARERSLVGTPEDCAEQLDRYRQAGATHCAVMAHPPYDVAGLELLARECFPAFR
jgi:alkanesulfonate monooxygenase SsuD/methylene tetrahydromethanopterin reductase-like flavin-dependent oxidoreductase (luciferase family)